jgi:hypothetical protein
MRRIQILLLFLLIPGAVVGQTAGYIGYKYKAVLPDSVLPNGVKSLGGALVGDINAQPLWDISIMTKGKDRMLWLERAVKQGAKGVEEWEVVDVLMFPNFPRGDELIFGTGDCTKSKKPDGDLVVQARLNSSTFTYKTIKAWRTNPKLGKFVPEDASLVKCKYDAP